MKNETRGKRWKIGDEERKQGVNSWKLEVSLIKETRGKQLKIKEEK